MDLATIRTIISINNLGLNLLVAAQATHINLLGIDIKGHFPSFLLDLLSGYDPIVTTG